MKGTLRTNKCVVTQNMIAHKQHVWNNIIAQDWQKAAMSHLSTAPSHVDNFVAAYITKTGLCAVCV
jgi:hypothetical protein